MIIDKKQEAYKLCDHINKNVCMGFSSRTLSDSSVLLSYSGFSGEFEMSLEFHYEYKVWMLDPCTYSVPGRLPTMLNEKNQIGFITLALASYNVATNKRLSK
ncbi:MAG: hypothetical protein ACXW1D_00370 [Halobacteriota archaeon]